MDLRKLMDIVSDKPILKESTIVECPMATPVQPNNDFVSMNISLQAQGIANIRDALQLIHNVENHGQEAVKPMDMPTPGLGIISKPDDSIDRIKGLAGLDAVIEPEAKDEGLIGGALGAATGAALGGPAGAVAGYSAGSKIGDDITDESAYDRWKTSAPEDNGPEYWCGHGEHEVELEIPAPYDISNYPESGVVRAGESMLVTAYVDCEGEDFKINAIDFGNEDGETIDLARAGQKWLDNVKDDISPKVETEYEPEERDFDESQAFDFDKENEKDEELEEIKRLSGMPQTKKTEEGYTITRDIDRNRYTDLSHEGLEGPFQLKSGKVVYYDKKEGKYYDRDSDIYLDTDEYMAHDKELGEIKKLSGLKSEEFANSVNKENEIKFDHKTLSDLDKYASRKQYPLGKGDNKMNKLDVTMEDSIRHDLMNLYKSIRENK